MKRNKLIESLILAIEKETKGEYTCIKIEKNTLFSYYKIEIKKERKENKHENH